MHRVLLLVGLAACWRTTAAPEPAAVPSPARPAPVVDESSDPAPCYKFDARNPVCKDECPRDAPDEWPACVEATRQSLARGFACTGNSPYSCTPPPPKPPCPPNVQCQPIHARVIALRVTGSDLVITIAAGKNQGVTTSWKATLADANKKPVTNAVIAIEAINDVYLTGRITMTAGQLRATPYVLLEP